MINIQTNTFTKIKNYIDEKYNDLFIDDNFKNGTTLSITDENNHLYGFINDDIDIPIFIPNKNIGIATESFNKYLEYKGINSCIINFNNNIKTIYQNKPKLKIERYNIDDIYNYDFSIILKKDETLYHIGQKVKQNYIDENNDIIVTIYYYDIIGDREIFGNISSDRLLGFKKHIIWWTENNEIGLEKKIDVKNISRKEEGDILRQRRQRQIANLENLAIGTPVETIMSIIYNYYNVEITNYINRRDIDFKDNMISETDPTIKSYLNIELPHNLILDRCIQIDDYYLYEINYENCYLKHYGIINDNYQVFYNNEIYNCVFLGIIDNKYYKLKIENIDKIENSIIINMKIRVIDFILHEIDINLHI